MTKPLIIPVFIPHMGCPHQCAFCNQHFITQTRSFANFDIIHTTIRQYLEYKGDRTHVEVAFFGGNFLGLNPDLVIRLLDEVLPYINNGTVSGIRFSTRPDSIDKNSLRLIQKYPISVVELGVQSMNDKVLKKSMRGHTARDNRQAILLLRETAAAVGVQLMVGLPGDSMHTLVESTKNVSELLPDFARIYPLLVLEGSALAEWYRKGSYLPLSLDGAVEQTALMYRELTQSGIRIIRMGLQASEFFEDATRVLAGPWHPAFGHLVLGRILYEDCCGMLDEIPGVANGMMIQIGVNPRSESRLRGNKNRQFQSFQEQYSASKIEIVSDDTISEGVLKISAIPPPPS